MVERRTTGLFRWTNHYHPECDLEARGVDTCPHCDGKGEIDVAKDEGDKE